MNPAVRHQPPSTHGEAMFLKATELPTELQNTVPDGFANQTNWFFRALAPALGMGSVSITTINHPQAGRVFKLELQIGTAKATYHQTAFGLYMLAFTLNHYNNNRVNDMTALVMDNAGQGQAIFPLWSWDKLVKAANDCLGPDMTMACREMAAIIASLSDVPLSQKEEGDELVLKNDEDKPKPPTLH